MRIPISLSDIFRQSYFYNECIAHLLYTWSENGIDKFVFHIYAKFIVLDHVKSTKG